MVIKQYANEKFSEPCFLKGLSLITCRVLWYICLPQTSSFLSLHIFYLCLTAASFTLVQKHEPSTQVRAARAWGGDAGASELCIS